MLTEIRTDPAAAPYPGCEVPRPGLGGTGSGSYEDPQGNYTQGWEWAMPTTLTAGATASIKAAINVTNASGAAARISMRPPAEFGVNTGARPEIEARVPVGAPGSDTETETYTFTPTRDFVAGEKLGILVGIGCWNMYYEYTGMAAPPPAGETVAAPAPGKTKRVSLPTPAGRRTTIKVSGPVSGNAIVTEADLLGDAVAACVLIGPDGIDVRGNQRLAEQLRSDSILKLYDSVVRTGNGRALVGLCLGIARAIGITRLPNIGTQSQAACGTARVAVRRGKRRLAVVQRRAQVTSTCTRTADSLTITITAKGSLRTQLGPELELGVYRRPDAPAAAGELTFTPAG